MRGWIILDSLISVAGLASLASGRTAFGSSVSLTALGLLLLMLTLGARMVRGRA